MLSSTEDQRIQQCITMVLGITKRNQKGTLVQCMLYTYIYIYIYGTYETTVQYIHMKYRTYLSIYTYINIHTYAYIHTTYILCIYVHNII